MRLGFTLAVGLVLGGCAAQQTQQQAAAPVEEAPEKSPEQLERERKEAEEVKVKAARAARMKELETLAAESLLLDVPEHEWQRIRATSLGELAQLRYEESNLEGAIGAIDQAAQAAERSQDPKLYEGLNDSRILIYRFISLELAGSKDYDSALHLIDVLGRTPRLLPRQRADIAGFRLLVLEMKGNKEEKRRNKAVMAALSRMLTRERADDSPEAPKMNGDKFDLSSMRGAMSRAIGSSLGDVSESELPSEGPAGLVVGGGQLDQRTVLQVVSANKRSVAACYNRAMRGAGGFRGKLELEAQVQPSGQVSGASVLTEEFKGKPVAECIRDAVVRWRFPPFEGETKNVILPFVLDYFGEG